ncbi:hypothetical protein PMIN01_05914 [Paraphaeosphaeria minitans]|uniref:Uncharacterized protein n=1 Tax=Paraphaeosphaeria minitans TaxID=565426 RepID=A0A9P6KRU5_9PLEO|nr:hypothetical protein PMIN01_05914 [Paraphaeosphaeria minitans]
MAHTLAQPEITNFHIPIVWPAVVRVEARYRQATCLRACVLHSLVDVLGHLDRETFSRLRLSLAAWRKSGLSSGVDLAMAFTLGGVGAGCLPGVARTEGTRQSCLEKVLREWRAMGTRLRCKVGEVDLVVYRDRRRNLTALGPGSVLFGNGALGSLEVEAFQTHPKVSEETWTMGSKSMLAVQPECDEL